MPAFLLKCGWLLCQSVCLREIVSRSQTALHLIGEDRHQMDRHALIIGAFTAVAGDDGGHAALRAPIQVLPSDVPEEGAAIAIVGVFGGIGRARHACLLIPIISQHNMVMDRIKEFFNGNMKLPPRCGEASFGWAKRNRRQVCLRLVRACGARAARRHGSRSGCHTTSDFETNKNRRTHRKF